MFDVQVTVESSVLKVNMQGELDIAGVDLLEEQLGNIDLQVLTKVQFDLQQLEFIDSTGVGSLLNLTRSIKEQGIEIKIMNMKEDIKEIFRILDLEEIFENN